ncbi:hypothetical protein B5M09_013682, partial [Aphanomyces astaci]
MDKFTKKRVAMWHVTNRDYRGITEAEWAAWFKKAFEEEPQDLEVLKNRLTTAIRFVTTIMDADSRIGKMLENLMRGLERDNQAWVLDQGGKTVVDIMAKAIKPLGLRSRSNACWPSNQWTSPVLPTPEQDSAKYERKKGTSLKCGSENHKVVNSPSARLANPSAFMVISPEPSVIQPYGQAPALKVDHQKQFKLVTLDTPCGPLARRGLKAWVDSSSNAAELLISRAVVERLGFSEDEFLSHAFAKQEVWDVSDVDKPSAMASVSRLTQVA